MTTLFPGQVTCALCGTVSTHQMVGSTNSFGSPDLDGRPPEMRRSTMPYWVRECPRCGYCNDDIAVGDDAARDVVASEDYRTLRGDESVPQVARTFACAAMIAQARDQDARRLSHLMAAAWSCDDADDPASAARFRRAAAGVLEDLRRRGDAYLSDTPAVDQVVLADLHRRAGDLARAKEVANAAPDTGAEEWVGWLLALESRLAAAGDTGVHTLDEAAPEGGASEQQVLEIFEEGDGD